MKSMISSAKKISFDCRVQIRRYELKQKTGKRWRERQRQTDRQRNRDRERINFQIKKKKIQSRSPSPSLQIYLGHMLVSVGSTALAAAVILPRYGGLNYASRCITVYNARVKILNKSVSFITKCFMATERVTENV